MLAAGRDPVLSGGRSPRSGSRPVGGARGRGQRVYVGRLVGYVGGDGRRRAPLGSGFGHHRDRAAAPAGVRSRRGRIRRPQFPLGVLGPRLRPARQARCRDRHRRQRCPVRAGDRAARRSPARVPADRQLVPAAREPAIPSVDAVGDRTRPRSAGIPPPVHLRVRRVAHVDDPPPAYVRARRPAEVDAVHAQAGPRSGVAAQDLAGLHLRLQAGPVQLDVPAGARAPERRARDRAHHAV